MARGSGRGSLRLRASMITRPVASGPDKSVGALQCLERRPLCVWSMPRRSGPKRLGHERCGVSLNTPSPTLSALRDCSSPPAWGGVFPPSSLLRVLRWSLCIVLRCGVVYRKGSFASFFSPMSTRVCCRRALPHVAAEKSK